MDLFILKPSQLPGEHTARLRFFGAQKLSRTWSKLILSYQMPIIMLIFFMVKITNSNNGSTIRVGSYCYLMSEKPNLTEWFFSSADECQSGSDHCDCLVDPGSATGATLPCVCQFGFRPTVDGQSCEGKGFGQRDWAIPSDNWCKTL